MTTPTTGPDELRERLATLHKRFVDMAAGHWGHVCTPTVTAAAEDSEAALIRDALAAALASEGAGEREADALWEYRPAYERGYADGYVDASGVECENVPATDGERELAAYARSLRIKSHPWRVARDNVIQRARDVAGQYEDGTPITDPVRLVRALREMDRLRAAMHPHESEADDASDR